MKTGGQILIEQLAAEGVRHIFTVPGESFLAVLDALHGSSAIAPITCRNEAGAAMMAEATGKLLGRPGIALVTRGPGAANAMAGLYIARQDATAMILLVGLPPSSQAGRPAFQAIDIGAVFGSLAKWTAVVPSPARIVDHVQRAYKIAMSGRPGPVVLGLPEDLLFEVTPQGALAAAEIDVLEPSAARIATLHFLLEGAERPLVIVGGAPWSAEAAGHLAAFAERFDLPVITSFRRQDHLDNRHRCYAGHAGLAMEPHIATALKGCDLLIALGDSLGDVSTRGFTLLKPPVPSQKLVRIAPDPGVEGVYCATLDVPASPVRAVKALASLVPSPKAPPWQIWRRDLRAAYEASLRPRPTPGSVQLEEIVTKLSSLLPPDAIVCNGAGNYAAFLARYFTYKSYPSQLAPLSGSMGYGLPAAIAAKLACPDRTVVALAGDGCFQMTALELATAVQFGLEIVIIVANNRSLGTIRMHQERRYPGRVVATSLVNPDFVALALSMGASGERVTETRQFPGALGRAFGAGRPAVVELHLDTDALSPLESIESIRTNGEKSPPQ